MPKTNITSLVTMLSTMSLLAATGVTTLLAEQAEAQNRPWGQQPIKEQKQALPQTTKLEQNDNLDPTVNRTQAMRTEAETGSISSITTPPKVGPVKPTKPKAAAKSLKGKKVWHEY
jgi:hypothetical protein